MRFSYMLLVLVICSCDQQKQSKEIRVRVEQKNNVDTIMTNLNDGIQEVRVIKDSGLILEGRYEEGLKSGKWTYFYDNGGEKKVEGYSSGKIMGWSFGYYKDGSTQFVKEYVPVKDYFDEEVNQWVYKEPKLNRNVIYNESQKVVDDGSFYFNVNRYDVDDTMQFGEKYLIKIKYVNSTKGSNPYFEYGGYSTPFFIKDEDKTTEVMPFEGDSIEFYYIPQKLGDQSLAGAILDKKDDSDSVQVMYVGHYFYVKP